MKQTLNHISDTRAAGQIDLRTVGHSQGRGTGSTLTPEFWDIFCFSEDQT